MRHLLQSHFGSQRQRGAREPEYPDREREKWGQARVCDGEEKKMKLTFKRYRVMGLFCLAAILTSLFRVFR